jgi:hypothetical protein
MIVPDFSGDHITKTGFVTSQCESQLSLSCRQYFRLILPFIRCPDIGLLMSDAEPHGKLTSLTFLKISLVFREYPAYIRPSRAQGAQTAKQVVCTTVNHI